MTISFYLQPGFAWGDAVIAITETAPSSGMPSTIAPSFPGSAPEFQKSLSNQLLLIAAALATVSLVSDMLYANLVHPITIISPLPSAGVGALLALLACIKELSIIAFIGIILLINIVKMNAILMIDLAIMVQRRDRVLASVAIREGF